MIFILDFVTHENYWQIASLVTQKLLFTVTYALFFIQPSMAKHYILFFKLFMKLAQNMNHIWMRVSEKHITPLLPSRTYASSALINAYGRTTVTCTWSMLHKQFITTSTKCRLVLKDERWWFKDHTNFGCLHIISWFCIQDWNILWAKLRWKYLYSQRFGTHVILCIHK